MSARARLSAIGVAATVIGLTLPASADPASTVEAAPAPVAVVAPAPAPVEGTPLSLRPGKPLELAPEPAHTGWGWKLVALLSIGGGAAYYWRKRRGQGAAVEASPLLIVHRASVGIRSELLVVNVEGQRLLIGVTPQSIQSLAILDAGEPRAEEVPAPAGRSLEDRVQAMLESVERRRPAEVTVNEDDEKGQARGLLALRRRG